MKCNVMKKRMIVLLILFSMLPTDSLCGRKHKEFLKFLVSNKTMVGLILGGSFHDGYHNEDKNKYIGGATSTVVYSVGGTFFTKATGGTFFVRTLKLFPCVTYFYVWGVLSNKIHKKLDAL